MLRRHGTTWIDTLNRSNDSRHITRCKDLGNFRTIACAFRVRLNQARLKHRNRELVALAKFHAIEHLTKTAEIHLRKNIG